MVRSRSRGQPMLPTLANTIGAAYIGIVFSAVFFGVTLLQAYNYYARFPKDWMVHRVSVGAMCLLDALHLSLSIHLGYHYLILNFANFAALGVIVWSLKLQIAINVCIIMWVQSLYALRVWKLGRGHHQKLIPYLIILVVATGYVTGTLLAIFAFKIDLFAKLDTISWVIILSFATTTFNDICIAGAMCYYLQKSRSGFSETNSKISTLIQYTLSSGLITSACSMTCLIAFCTMPNNLIFLAIEFSLTKLYINSFLAMLNARQSINGRNETGISVSLTELRSGSGNAHTADPSGFRMKRTSKVDHDASFACAEAKQVYPWAIAEQGEDSV